MENLQKAKGELIRELRREVIFYLLTVIFLPLGIITLVFDKLPGRLFSIGYILAGSLLFMLALSVFLLVITLLMLSNLKKRNISPEEGRGLLKKIRPYLVLRSSIGGFFIGFSIFWLATSLNGVFDFTVFILGLISLIFGSLVVISNLFLISSE